MHFNYSNTDLIEILNGVKVIAIIGASIDPIKDSNKVMRTLLDKGYQVIPINPNHKNRLIFGQECFEDIEQVKKKIDMVDIFRPAKCLMDITKKSISVGVKVLWTQENIIHYEAAELAKNAGLKVVMNRCPIKVFLSQTGSLKRNNPL